MVHVQYWKLLLPKLMQILNKHNLVQITRLSTTLLNKITKVRDDPYLLNELLKSNIGNLIISKQHTNHSRYTKW